jgi:hypothetical protein
MNKHVLNEKVYYYENAIENFDQLMKNINELDGSLWGEWTASDDKTFVYGQTQAFNIEQIELLEEPEKNKRSFIFHTIMEAFYDVCKDYATAMGDHDEPNLFPVFNIKKYNTGSAMGSHFDQLDGDKTLRYSLVMYLNDECEGGEISFKLGEYDDIFSKPSPELDYEIALKNNSIDFGVKPKAGSIIIFPSSAPYFHTAHLVKSGIKYMVPGHWIHNDTPLQQKYKRR